VDSKKEFGKKMKKDKYSINQWLSALFTEGQTPWGKDVKIVRVPEGESVEIWSGGSYFGSGGGYTHSYWAGSEPLVDTEKKGGHTDNGFVSESGTFYIMKSPMVLYTTSGDDIGHGRVFYRRAYVCATEDQIAAAKLAAPYEPTGWRLKTHDFYGYKSWSLKPLYWGSDLAEHGLKLATKTYGGGGNLTLLYIPEDGSMPIELGSFYWTTECHCDAQYYDFDDSDAPECICENDPIPNSIEEAVRFLRSSKKLRQALEAYLKGGKGMMVAIKAAAKEIEQQ
jgi:hypothetical protein